MSKWLAWRSANWGGKTCPECGQHYGTKAEGRNSPAQAFCLLPGCYEVSRFPPLHPCTVKFLLHTTPKCSGASYPWTETFKNWNAFFFNLLFSVFYHNDTKLSNTDVKAILGRPNTKCHVALISASQVYWACSEVNSQVYLQLRNPEGSIWDFHRVTESLSLSNSPEHPRENKPINSLYSSPSCSFISWYFILFLFFHIEPWKEKGAYALLHVGPWTCLWSVSSRCLLGWCAVSLHLFFCLGLCIKIKNLRFIQTSSSFVSATMPYKISVEFISRRLKTGFWVLALVSTECSSEQLLLYISVSMIMKWEIIEPISHGYCGDQLLRWYVLVLSATCAIHAVRWKSYCSDLNLTQCGSERPSDKERKENKQSLVPSKTTQPPFPIPLPPTEQMANPL